MFQVKKNYQFRKLDPDPNGKKNSDTQPWKIPPDLCLFLFFLSLLSSRSGFGGPPPAPPWYPSGGLSWARPCSTHTPQSIPIVCFGSDRQFISLYDQNLILKRYVLLFTI